MNTISTKFPEPKITAASMAWFHVGDNLRERSLCVLSRRNADTGLVYGYSSLGIEANTTVLLVEPDWASVKRSEATFPIRIVPRYNSVKHRNFLDLAEDNPFSGEVTEIVVSDVPAISDEFRIYTTRKSHPNLLPVSQGVPLNVYIDREVIPAFAVSINDGTSLILEFDLLKYIAAERKRITSSNIFGDVKLVQEIVSVDETAYPRFIYTGKHYAMRTSRRELAYNECFVESEVSENPINEIACLQYLRNNCQHEKAHEHVDEIREAFATRHYVFTVSKYLGGRTVAELKRTKPDISEEVVKTIVHEILSALTLFHKNGIQHGAVSPSTVFVRLRKNSKPTFVLSEPGHAQRVAIADDELADTLFDRPRDCSTSLFSEDIWSLGILTLFLFTGIEYSRTEIFEAAAHRLIDLLPTWQPNILLKATTSPLALSFISQMLIVDPADIPCTAEQLLDHPWFHATGTAKQPAPSK